MSRKERPLDSVQRWFQTAITHIGGVKNAPHAEEDLASSENPVEEIIRRSVRLTSLERISIYANAYYARLLECLGGCFPTLKRALGAEVFDSFCLEYLQQYPSRSYTLDQLGEHFCDFLKETRPAKEEDESDTEWPDFLIDLANLEWTIGRIFDGPGAEGTTMLRPEDLQSIAPERIADAKLIPVVCLRLLSFRFPVNAYFTLVRAAAEEEEVPIPEPSPEYVAILRRDYIVRRYPLTEFQHQLLQRILDGATVGEAIESVSQSTKMDDEALSQLLQSSFQQWAAAGFFSGIAF